MRMKENVQLISWTGEVIVMLVTVAIVIFVWRMSKRKADRRNKPPKGNPDAG
jgi:heme/copper-type cytochrome/quinol oxidase subunit 2